MSPRRFLRRAVLLLVAVATGATGLGTSFHELEALRGHEHCGREEAGVSIGHVCHDEDECTVCGLLALPSTSDAAPQPPEAPVAAPELLEAAPVEAVVADPAGIATARAPPAA